MAKGGRRPGAGRPKGKTEVAGKIRSAFIDACAILEGEGHDLAHMMADVMRQGNVAHVLKAVALFVPRHVRQDISHQHNVEIGLTPDSAARIQQKLAEWTSAPLEGDHPPVIRRLPHSD